MEQIGKYTIVEEIGRGGMGRVYKARDPVIGRDVAIKVILERVLEIPEARRRFYREARTAGNLAHENIVVVHDAGEEDGLPYIVMEFLEGRDLRQAMDGESLPLTEKLNIALSIGRGLRYAHDHGVTHRDIKPENVRLGDGYGVKIVDFGIARLESGTQTLTNATLGTPRYMSPEQIKGAAVDHRSDIFSFGAVLYELLAGRCPFGGDNVTTLIYQILHEEPRPIELDNSRLSVELQHIVSRCLEKDVDQRYADFGDVIRDIERLSATEEVDETVFMAGAPVDPGQDVDSTRRMTAVEEVPSPPVESGHEPASEGHPSKRTVQSIVFGAVVFLTTVGLIFFVLREPTAIPDEELMATGRLGGSDESETRSEVEGEFVTGGAEPRDDAGGRAGGDADGTTGGDAGARTSDDADGGTGGDSEAGAGDLEPEKASKITAGGGDSDRAASNADPDEALKESADAANMEMEGARRQLVSSHEDAPSGSTFETAESLREKGRIQYEEGGYGEAISFFAEATNLYKQAGEEFESRRAAREGRAEADDRYSELMSVKRSVPPSIHGDRAYERGLAYENEGRTAYDSGDYARANDRYDLARDYYREAIAPESIVEAEGRSMQTSLREAILQEDWSRVPRLVSDGYSKHVQDVRKFWRITDVTISDQSPQIAGDGSTATLPVTLTLHYVQPGGFDPGNFSLFFNWIWREDDGILQLSQIELVRTSK